MKSKILIAAIMAAGITSGAMATEMSKTPTEVKKEAYEKVAKTKDQKAKLIEAKKVNDKLNKVEIKKETKTKVSTLEQKEIKKANFDKIAGQKDAKLKAELAKKENERLKKLQK